MIGYRRKPATTRQPARSRWLKAVLALVREAYPETPVREEQNLGELVKDLEIPDYVQQAADAVGTSITKMRVDLYLVGHCCIEVHGEQHRTPVLFANTILDPTAELERRKEMDRIKQKVLELAAIPTLTFWYDEIPALTAEEIRRRVAEAVSKAQEVPAQNVVNVKPARSRTREEAYQLRAKQLDQAKKKRHEAYQKARAAKREQRQAQRDMAKAAAREAAKGRPCR